MFGFHFVEAHRALELLEDYHSRLAAPQDRTLRIAIERVIKIFKSRLFQALLGEYIPFFLHGRIYRPEEKTMFSRSNFTFAEVFFSFLEFLIPFEFQDFFHFMWNVQRIRPNSLNCHWNCNCFLENKRKSWKIDNNRLHGTHSLYIFSMTYSVFLGVSWISINKSFENTGYCSKIDF